MTTDPKPLAPDVVDIYATSTSLPSNFVRQVISTLKARGRIGSGRPVSPPIQPRDIARTVLALTSPSVRQCVDVETACGSLPLSAGDGQPCVEDHLVDLIEEAAGWRNGDANFRDGQVILGGAEMIIIGPATYRTERRRQAGLQRYSLIQNRAIAQIARTLLPARRGNF